MCIIKHISFEDLKWYNYLVCILGKGLYISRYMMCQAGKFKRVCLRNIQEDRGDSLEEGLRQVQAEKSGAHKAFTY